MPLLPVVAAPVHRCLSLFGPFSCISPPLRPSSQAHPQVTTAHPCHCHPRPPFPFMRRPALLRPSRRPPLLFPLSVLLLFPLVLPFAASTTFSIHPTPANEPRKAPTYFRLSPRAEDFVFGLTRQGIFEANFTSIKYDPQDARQCPIDLVFCNVSSQFVRSPSLERRHAQGTIQSLLLAVRKHHCNGSSNTTIDLECNHEPMPKSPPARVRHAPHADNEMYIAVLVACRCDAFNKPFSLDLQGEAQWLNPNLNPHQHLGWEEVHFPPVALSALILFALEFFLFLAYGFIALRRHLRVPYSFLLILNSAALFKAIHASLTYAYFASVSRTGTRASWYLYSRVSVVAVADVAFICAASAVSSGFCVLPDDWFVDARSPVFSVYIGITLQVLIIITVKLMFPFRYLSKKSLYSCLFHMFQFFSGNTNSFATVLLMLHFFFLLPVACTSTFTTCVLYDLFLQPSPVFVRKRCSCLRYCGGDNRCRHILGLLQKPSFHAPLCQTHRTSTHICQHYSHSANDAVLPDQCLHYSPSLCLQNVECWLVGLRI